MSSGSSHITSGMIGDSTLGHSDHIAGSQKTKHVKQGAAGRRSTDQTMLPLRIVDEDHLYKAYMPFLSNGGLFVETTKIYGLGQKIRLIVRMPDSDDKLTLAGAIAWVTPKSIRSGKKKGVGVAFTDTKGANLAKEIEHLLRYRLTSDEPTYTM